jgi:hypothetical protein
MLAAAIDERNRRVKRLLLRTDLFSNVRRTAVTKRMRVEQEARSSGDVEFGRPRSGRCVIGANSTPGAKPF